MFRKKIKNKNQSIDEIIFVKQAFVFMKFSKKNGMNKNNLMFLKNNIAKYTEI